MFFYILAHTVAWILLYIGFWNIINYIEKKKLKKCIQLEGYFERFNDLDKSVRNNLTLDQYISGTRILFPWENPIINKNIFIVNNKYEGGFPHTHGPYIMTPSLKRLTNHTYKHEKMHIFQRYNPLEVNKEITKQNPIIGVSCTSTSRANPDTNCIQYKGFSSDFLPNPKYLSDITSSLKDHPYEEMAYKIT